MNCNVISTGSKGNAVLLDGRILLDCGVPFRQIEPYADALDLVLVSHKHGDHFNRATIKRLASLRPSLKWACGRFLVPLMAEIVPLRNILPLEPGAAWKLSDGTEFQCFSLVHDVPNVGFIVKVCGETAVYAVDTQYIPANIPGADLYLIEANYEEHELQDRLEMKLKHGAWAYETSAFARHMSREAACKWLAENAGPESEVIFLHQHGG